jgi:tRNA/rRNA methyltransferase
LCNGDKIFLASYTKIGFREKEERKKQKEAAALKKNAGRNIKKYMKNSDAYTIVLNRPKFPGNVGSAARSAMNMGIEKIIIVGNGALDKEEMKTMSTHVAAHIVDGIRYFDNLEEALAEFHYVVGTSARLGKARGPVVSPREMAQRLPEIAKENDIALLFGPEDAGLSNDELRFCHLVVKIPTSAQFKSINLSHAVMILCYEIFIVQASRAGVFTPRLATSAELEGMYDQMEGVLSKIGYLNPQNPEYWMMHIRRFLARVKLYSKEVKIIRGVCRKLTWYEKNKNT